MWGAAENRRCCLYNNSLKQSAVASLDEVPGLAGDNKTELQTHVDAFKSEVENSLITELQK